MNPTLYILVRIDLLSLVGSPEHRAIGKAVAQGCHAAHQFTNNINRMEVEYRRDIAINPTDPIAHHAWEIVALARQWERSTPDGFGTTITLGVNEQQMRAAVRVARALGFEAAITHDPTYPIVDTVEGQPPQVHLIPLDTGGYVFIDRSDPIAFAIVSQLPLMN